MKIQRQRNACQLKFPPFHSHQQLKRLNCLCIAIPTSPRTKRDDTATVTVQDTATGISLEHIIVGSFCWSMSLYFIIMIVVGS
jgi:hypothetical protein